MRCATPVVAGCVYLCSHRAINRSTCVCGSGAGGYNVTLGSWLDAPATGTEPVIGAPLTLADARVLAAQCLRQVKTGTHPSAFTRRQADANNVQSVADEYMKREGSKLRSAAQIANTILI
jgi:hypothetical protein